jgi:hypothetical protein
VRMADAGNARSVHTALHHFHDIGTLTFTTARIFTGRGGTLCNTYGQATAIAPYAIASSNACGSLAASTYPYINPLTYPGINPAGVLPRGAGTSATAVATANAGVNGAGPAILASATPVRGLALAAFESTAVVCSPC